ncbi:hypothetical protein AAGG74_16710 [Bacillus mexicanus]|uniref:hypothetical protein n=1 Tax=Bacillus mexicanus TaxID=2834415 RepID=UPI003D1B75DA
MKDTIENLFKTFDLNLFLKENFDLNSIEVPEEMPKFWVDIPTSDNWDPLGFTKELTLRDAYIKKGMFGFVSWKWINPFAEWLNGRKCLELMAGRGWLSYALSLKDINIIATDNFSWHEHHSKWNDTLVDIEKIDAVKAVEKYASQVDVVIISWPYKGSETYNSLKTLNKFNPDALFVFIGEQDEGVCADKEFFNHLKEIEDEDFLAVKQNFQSWKGIYDRIILGKYIN